MDSPAAKAGLKEGDIIVALEGESVETMSQLIKDLFKYRPGDTIKLTIIRDLVKSTVDVTLTDFVEE